MKRFLWTSSILTIAVLTGFYILSTWRGFYPYRPTLSAEGFLRAIDIDPSNPDPFYRLGVFHQWEIHNIDLKKSLYYLKEAIKRNPLEQEYWLSLAKVFQRMGDAQAAGEALEKSVMVFPTGYQGRWMAGNLLLLQEEYEKAIPHFSYILTHYPNQSGLVYDVWGKVVQDPDFILKRLVPKDPFSLGQYLSYLYETGDRETAKKVWGERVSLGYKADRAETIRHVDFLISRGDLLDAYRIFVGRLREEGLPIPSDKNLLINGGFEKEKVLGGGFDWRIGTVPGAEVSYDHLVSFEGKSSLKIFFTGKENVDYHHLYQFVALKPNQDYLLSAQVKTKTVTTRSGIKLEIAGIGPAFHGASEALTGDNAWRELSVSFRTPRDSQGGVVRLRREKTDKFDRFISGTVWVDNVQLKEK
ncbi:MAG: carbohydrate binding domain-containing protein [Thermodesulfobacteriota bacterium]|nr:carbohydrate binding domain-containing protein [Thermodesulfobacteriota bacterium]